MSTILPTPNLPALINLEDMKAYIQSEIQKAVNPLSEKIKELEEKNVRLRRHISILEGHLNINYSDYDDVVITDAPHDDLREEGITTVSDRIEALERNTVLAPEKLIEEKKDIDPIIANTTLTKKASALTEYLEKKTKANWSGKVVLENQDIYTFFKEIIQEDLRWPERMKGYRGAKKSIIERAQELFPHKVEVVRNKSGNKITGLALKPSLKRTDTYGC